MAGRSGDRGLSVRPLSEAARSTRVFNETKGAFLAALDEVVSRGIRHVVLLGDYTDDGQVATTGASPRFWTAIGRRMGFIFMLCPAITMFSPITGVIAPSDSCAPMAHPRLSQATRIATARVCR